MIISRLEILVHFTERVLAGVTGWFECYNQFIIKSQNALSIFVHCLLVWTFYLTWLARQKFYLEKNLPSGSSRGKFKNGNDSTRLSFYGFILSEFRVLIKNFWRSIVNFKHLQKMFCHWSRYGLGGHPKNFDVCCFHTKFDPNVLPVKKKIDPK